MLTTTKTTTIADAARTLGCSETLVRNAIRRGELRASRLGRRYFLNCADVLSLLHRAGVRA